MASRFLVGTGSRTWTNADTSIWSDTSGGASGASVPGVNDTVTFDSNSGTGTVTINYSPSLQSLTCTSANITLSAGANTFTLAGVALAWDWQAGTFTAGTSTVSMVAVGFYFINATGMSFYNLNRTGTAVKTDGLQLNSDVTVTNTLTLAGNSTINRLVIRSSDVSVQRTFTANGTIAASNLDIQDIIGAGSASWDLSGATGGSSDRGHNTNITFTAAATQTANGTTSFSWSTAARWSGSPGRVPLAQDDVVVANAFGASQTITMDMLVLGHDVSFSGVTGSPALTVSTGIAGNIYGDLTLDADLGTITLNAAIRLTGTGSHTITTDGKSITGGASVLQVFSNGGTYTLQDDMVISTTGGLQVLAGTFNTNDNDITATLLVVGFNLGVLPVVVNLGASTLTSTSTAVATVWNSNNTGGLTTINAGTSIIRLLGATTNTRTFAGAGHTYNIVRYGVGNSTGAFVITGDNTFNELNVFDNFGPKTLTFTAGSTQTITDWDVSGASHGNITVNSSTNGTTYNLVGSGTPSADYLTIRDANASGVSWYAGNNSSDAGNNTGWRFMDPVFDKFNYLHSKQSQANDTSYTFTAADLGDAAGDRYIIVAVSGRKAGAATPTITSVTIGGVSATIAVQHFNTVSDTNIAGIAIALVPTGTTGDIVVVFPATQVRCAVGVYRATGLSSITASDTDSATVGPSVTLDVPANGFAIGTGLTAATTTATWTELTEKQDASFVEAGTSYTTAYKEYATAQTALAMGVDWGSETQAVAVFASWGFSNAKLLALLGVG